MRNRKAVEASLHPSQYNSTDVKVGILSDIAYGQTVLLEVLLDIRELLKKRKE